MNRDRIKNRILKRASQAWGYGDLVSENSFDPVLELLLTACASELEKLAFEQEYSQTRITDRILEVLFPDKTTGVIPAQTLLQIQPLENNTKISLYDSFKLIKRKQNLYDPTQTLTQELHFTPTLEVNLTTAQIKYLAFGNRLIEKENFFYEDTIARSEKLLPQGAYWVGIHCPNIEKLEDLNFYIDLNNSYQKELFFYYLKQAKVYVANKEYRLQEGFNQPIEAVNYEHIITNNYNSLEGIYNEINLHYWDNFFTLKGTIDVDTTSGDLLLNQYFPKQNKELFSEVVWLKFDFYEVIGSEVFENVTIALNCVPAANLHHGKETQRIKGKINILPILGKGHFLDIDYVCDDYGHRFDTKRYDPTASVSAVLRKSGVSRFDERNALEHIEQLLGIIKDETAAFSALGNDVIGQELKQIAQNLASIHQVIKEKDLVVNSNPFVIISAPDKELDMNCTLSYWHTFGQEGNDIKVGTPLEKLVENKVAVNKAIVIKPSFAGRNGGSTENKILEYRNALLSRGRIVTIADIKVFAKKHFKDTITELQVHKGTKKNISVKGGFQRTIDIHLFKNPSTQEGMTLTEWDYLKESFLIKLEKASANVYPYRLFEK